MSDPESFVSRWSRRKREAAESGIVRDTERPQTEDSVRADTGQAAARQNAMAPPAAAEAKPEPAFDVSKLPPIESITAATDIRPFLAPGVPASLTRAALRRAWSVDPSVRDFIGLAENDWDFNAPGVPGFDLSPPSGDLKRMVAEIFGEQSGGDSPEEAPEGNARPATSEEAGDSKSVVAHSSSHGVVNEGSERCRETSPEDSSQRAVAAEQHKKAFAAQSDGALQETTSQRIRRGHGGAMPR